MASGAGSNIVEVESLRKQYGPLVAVDSLNLQIGNQGTVHGFLGPNGSGKTTTIRCLLGLITPTSGRASVFGVDANTELHKVVHRIGAIVENPKLFPKFSGRQNLQLLGRAGGVGRARVEEVLTTVGLSGRGDDSFESYSLGMKQRLAIAAALLRDPDLLILDEPANGLDPAGIAEMRTLIRGIADQGKAVLVSSHQLAEIEQVCDDITIINQGQVVRSGPLAEVRDSVGETRVLVTIANQDAAVATLAAAGMPTTAAPDGRLEVQVDPERAADVTRVLADAGQYLEGLQVQRDTLESVFLQLTGTTAGEVGATAGPSVPSGPQGPPPNAPPGAPPSGSLPPPPAPTAGGAS